MVTYRGRDWGNTIQSNSGWKLSTGKCKVEYRVEVAKWSKVESGSSKVEGKKWSANQGMRGRSDDRGDMSGRGGGVREGPKKSFS